MTPKESLGTKGYVLLPDMLLRSECEAVLAAAEAAAAKTLPTIPAGLRDSEDKLNTIYDSRRSPGVQYAYLVEDQTNAVNRRVAEHLTQQFDINFLSGINGHCLPLFSYGEGATIKAHRGRDIGYGANDLVAVAMLTRPGTDYLGGQFYLNRHALASPDGKTVWRDFESDRQYFQLGQGDVLVFANNYFVHGTTPTSKVDGRCHRATCSWRAAKERRVPTRPRPTTQTKPLARVPEVIRIRARA